MDHQTNFLAKILFAVSFLGVFAFGVGLVRGEGFYQNYKKLGQSRDVLAKTVDDLEQESNALMQEIEKLQNSRGYARKVLRDKYHLVEEDETLHLLPD